MNARAAMAAAICLAGLALPCAAQQTGPQQTGPQQTGTEQAGTEQAGASPLGPACTTRMAPDGPARRIFACAGGLRFEAEAAAEIGIALDSTGAAPETIELRSGALYVEDAAGPARHFQIRTPQAIASVRGTVWAVEAGQDVTSVLVLEGAVAVSGSAGAVLLGPGEGVDMMPGERPVATHWGAARMEALLARFGR